MITKLLAVLPSTRFWALVLIAILGVLKVEAVLSAELVDALITLLAGFTIIRTVDKFSRK